MQRLTARFLLFLALVGIFLPLALAATTATAQHACCIRKAAHQCHGSFGLSDDRAVRSTSCCSHDCCRGVHVSQSAHPRPALPSIALNAVIRLVRSQSETVNAPLVTAPSSRAPPQFFLA